MYKSVIQAHQTQARPAQAHQAYTHLHHTHHTQAQRTHPVPAPPTQLTKREKMLQKFLKPVFPKFVIW